MTPTAPLLLKALHFAATKHRFQRRKDVEASPYINHPIAAAELLTRIGGITDTTVLVAADTETTLEELEAEFGKEVSGIVAEVTDDKSLAKAVRKERQIEHAPHASTAAKLIKLVDKICNVTDVIEHPAAGWSAERRLEYLAWAERVVAGCRGTNAALEGHFDAVVARGRGEIG
jgi:guanosine-3',5'-bis(diphosphate) 3'-pyrophosphohydrolase